GEIDTAVIAGMGGETIAAIIEASPWCRDCTLILQPMSRREKLGEYLRARKMNIAAERLVKENGEIYPILCVFGSEERPHEPCEAYISRSAFEKKEPLLGEYLESLLLRLGRAASGAERSRREGDSERAVLLRSAAEGLEKMRREYGI
ncbi:MAG: tRNA (adenine(22)-N(1))-methyltransferase TrmK, partial [Oscillospiraceae bacterium]|nr:tRNA (adenine(22)-N(1))-methyltransferase TrmK [Oscillospiraceae bacterium]